MVARLFFLGPFARRALPPARRVALSTALVALATLTAACASNGAGARRAPRAVVRGPIPARTEHPLALNYLGFRPRRAATQPAGTLGVALDSAYTSLYEAGSRGTDSVVVDGELWHGSLRLRWGAAERTDVEVEVGALLATGGFLDGLVERFHELFGFANGGREDRPQDELEVEIVDAGDEVYDLDHGGIALADVPIVLTHGLWDDGRGTLLAARAGVELPLASEDRGYGNGGLDGGFGLLGERSRGAWTLAAALDVVFPAERDSFDGTGVGPDELFDASLGLEYRCSDRASLLAGLMWLSPLSEEPPLEEIESSMLDLGLGTAVDVGERSRLTFSFHEDLLAASGPDFSLLVGWSTGL